MYIKNSGPFKFYKLSLNCIFSICDVKEIENLRIEGIEEEPSTKGFEDIIRGGVATHIESCGVDILAQHSKVVKQDDKMNEDKAGIMPNQEIQVEEGLNLLDKQEEIHIFSNNNIDISPGFFISSFLVSILYFHITLSNFL